MGRVTSTRTPIHSSEINTFYVSPSACSFDTQFITLVSSTRQFPYLGLRLPAGFYYSPRSVPFAWAIARA